LQKVFGQDSQAMIYAAIDTSRSEGGLVMTCKNDLYIDIVTYRQVARRFADVEARIYAPQRLSDLVQAEALYQELEELQQELNWMERTE
jgi:hypothetical protein